MTFPSYFLRRPSTMWNSTWSPKRYCYVQDTQVVWNTVWQILKEHKIGAWSVTRTKQNLSSSSPRLQSDSSHPESSETCQGDLLSCIEKLPDKERAASQTGSLLLLCGWGGWEHRGMTHSLSLTRTKAGEVADRSSDVSFYFPNAGGEEFITISMAALGVCVCVCECAPSDED